MRLPCGALSFGVVLLAAFVMDFAIYPAVDDDVIVGPNHHPHGEEDASCWLEFLSQGVSASSFGCDSQKAVESAAAKLLPILNRIVSRPYFRFVHVNLEKECPYWAVSLLCASEGAPCTVWSCDPNEVPKIYQCEEDMCNVELDRVCYSSQRSIAGVQPAAEFFVVRGDRRDPLALHVDLVKNIEANTAYVGPAARKIWEAIYNENCVFELNSQECSQQLVFYRLVSGLHASISTHLSIKFTRLPSSSSSGDGSIVSSSSSTFLPNCSEYTRRVGAHPHRIRNLHFLFRFLLQAASQAVASVDPSDLFCGDAADDAVLLSAINELRAGISNDGNFFGIGPHAFDLKQFAGYVQQGGNGEILAQVKQAMLNVTTLMNCLECEKCRLWGKVQTTGLAVALDEAAAAAVTSSSSSSSEVPRPAMARPKLVALINVLRQVTESFSLAQQCPSGA